jgi:hypothetical protein
VGSWIQAAGSPYNGWAYCQRFPRGGAEPAPGQAPQHWAQVGGAEVPVGNFDSIGWSMLTVFTLFTGENWNEVLYDGMRAAGPWSKFAALFFVVVIVVGQQMVLNLFLAVLLNKFDDKEERSAQREEQELEGRCLRIVAERAAEAKEAEQGLQQAKDAVARAKADWVRALQKGAGSQLAALQVSRAAPAA